MAAFVVVRKDGNPTYYLNGGVSGKVAIPNELAVSTDNFCIANWICGDNEHRDFKGIVDEAFVFSRALNQDEVTTTMNGSFTELLPVFPVDKVHARTGRATMLPGCALGRKPSAAISHRRFVFI